MISEFNQKILLLFLNKKQTTFTMIFEDDEWIITPKILVFTLEKIINTIETQE